MTSPENKEPPLFSVITPTLNAAATFAEAAKSVVEQNFSSFEHLVQDGGSTDKTSEEAAKFPAISFVQEKDSGLYDAMNRAVARSKGKWIVFLQADDWLEPLALQVFAKAMEANPASSILTGGARAICREAGIWQTRWEKNSEEEKALSFGQIALGEPMLNARAFRRDLWEKSGGFDLSYSLASDRDFLLRLAGMSPVCSTVAPVVYRYRWHDDSRTMNAGNSLSARLTAENLAIAESSWQRADGREKTILREWHRRESLRASMCALEAKDPIRFFSSFQRGWKIDRLFPLHFGFEFAKSFTGFLLRGGKTRSQILESEKAIRQRENSEKA